MTLVVNPHHYQSIRKRPYRKKPVNKAVYWFDKFIILAGVLTVVATVPQVIEIWTNKGADGVSSISWGYYVFYSASFTIYGFLHKEFPIIFNYSIATVLYVLVFVGSLIY